VQCLEASVVVHMPKCNGFGCEVTTKLDTKKLDLSGKISLRNLAETQPLSKFELVGVKTMLEGVSITGLSAAFSRQFKSSQ
jgi:hypothetical protein